MAGIEDTHKVRAVCLINAESLLSMAERELGKGADHVCFHLALLALEEIGKSALVTIGLTIGMTKEDDGDLKISTDDHVKKIFWALWGGVLIKGKFSKEFIEKNRSLSTVLHERRLESLYTNPNDAIEPSKRLKKEEAEDLIKLTRSRLEVEKEKKMKETLTEEDAQNLRWFLSATEDLEKRKFIFGLASLKKMEELGSGPEWIKWNKDIFQKHDDTMREYAEQELNRQKPSENEKFDPKYKVRVRIQSPSHTIKNDAFQKWNEGVNDIKLFKVDKRDLSDFAKSEMILEFYLPKSVQIQFLWDQSLLIIRIFLISLNIGSRGMFWWNFPKDIDNFFEEITDLEKSTSKEEIKIGIRQGKRLNLDWNSLKMKLDQSIVSRVMGVYSFVLYNFQKLGLFLRRYVMGMTLLAKNDIHLRLEANAFEEFFNALKEAMIAFGDWDGKSNFIEVVRKQFDKIPGGAFEGLEDTINLGLSLNLKPGDTSNITLTETFAMKLYCDMYIFIKTNEGLKKLSENDESSEEKE